MGTSGLGALLVEEGLLTESDRRTIKRTCGTQGSSFARAVIALGLLDEDELAAFLAERTRWRMTGKDLTRESSRDAWGAIDRPLIERLEVLPLRLSGQTLHVAMVDPLDHDSVKQIEFFTGYKVQPHIATFTQIRQGLERLLKGYKPQRSHLEDLINNHAVAASRRLRLIDQSRHPAAAKAKAVAVAAPQDAYADDNFDDDTLPFTPKDNEDGEPDADLEYPAASSKPMTGASSLDEDLELGDDSLMPADAASTGADAEEAVLASLADDPSMGANDLDEGDHVDDEKAKSVATLEGLDDLESVGDEELGLTSTDKDDALDDLAGFADDPTDAAPSADLVEIEDELAGGTDAAKAVMASDDEILGLDDELVPSAAILSANAEATAKPSARSMAAPAAADDILEIDRDLTEAAGDDLFGLDDELNGSTAPVAVDGTRELGDELAAGAAANTNATTSDLDEVFGISHEPIAEKALGLSDELTASVPASGSLGLDVDLNSGAAADESLEIDIDDELTSSAPASDPLGLDDELSSSAPASDPLGLDDELSSSAPASDPLGLDDELASSAPASDPLGLGDELTSSAPASDPLGLDDELTSSAPASDPLGLDDELTSSAPASDPLGLDDELTSSAPASDPLGLGDELTSSAPASDPLGLDDELTSSAPASDPLGLDDELTSSASASDPLGLDDELTSSASASDPLGLDDELTSSASVSDPLGLDDELTSSAPASDPLGLDDELTSSAPAIDPLGLDDELIGGAAAGDSLELDDKHSEGGASKRAATLSPEDDLTTDLSAEKIENYPEKKQKHFGDAQVNEILGLADNEELSFPDDPTGGLLKAAGDDAFADLKQPPHSGTPKLADSDGTLNDDALAELSDIDVELLGSTELRQSISDQENIFGESEILSGPPVGEENVFEVNDVAAAADANAEDLFGEGANPKPAAGADVNLFGESENHLAPAPDEKLLYGEHEIPATAASTVEERDVPAFSSDVDDDLFGEPLPDLPQASSLNMLAHEPGIDPIGVESDDATVDLLADFDRQHPTQILGVEERRPTNSSAKTQTQAPSATLHARFAEAEAADDFDLDIGDVSEADLGADILTVRAGSAAAAALSGQDEFDTIDEAIDFDVQTSSPSMAQGSEPTTPKSRPAAASSQTSAKAVPLSTGANARVLAPLVELASDSSAAQTSTIVASLNRSLLTLSLAKSFPDAVRRAAPILARSGVECALLLVQDGKQAKPLMMWSSPGPEAPLEVSEQNLYQYAPQALIAGMSRYSDRWQPAFDASRAADYKALTNWSKAGRVLMAMAVPATGERRLIMIAAWDSQLVAQDAIKDAAASVARKLAQALTA